jgi:hypothetical protein
MTKTAGGVSAEEEMGPSIAEFEEWLYDNLPKRWDWHMEFEVARECAWSASLRITIKPNRRNQPDESTVFYCAGLGGPDDFPSRVHPALERWLAVAATHGTRAGTHPPTISARQR